MPAAAIPSIYLAQLRVGSPTIRLTLSKRRYGACHHHRRHHRGYLSKQNQAFHTSPFLKALAGFVNPAMLASKYINALKPRSCNELGGTSLLRHARFTLTGAEPRSRG